MGIVGGLNLLYLATDRLYPLKTVQHHPTPGLSFCLSAKTLMHFDCTGEANGNHIHSNRIDSLPVCFASTFYSFIINVNAVLNTSMAR